MVKQLLIAIACMLIPAPLWAGTGVSGGAFTVSFSANSPTPTPATPVPTGTPTPAPSTCSAADPNLFGPGCTLLNYLYSLEGRGSSAHVLAGLTGVVKVCYDPSGCAVQDANNYANSGNKYYGFFGVDNCNAAWGDPTTPPCAFGTGAATNTEAKTMWNNGSVIFEHVDFPNPAVNTNNNNPGPGAAGNCGAGLSEEAKYQGVSYDCSGGMGDSYVQNMLTCPQSYCMHQGAQTSANASWNNELSLYVPGFQDLQNNGIPVIMDMYQEMDGNWFWWGTILSSGTFQALYRYTEGYWEAQGIHNMLYAFMPIGSGAGYRSPGNSYVDVGGWDQYGSYGGGGYIAPQYSDEVSYLGNKPQVWAEFGDGCSNSYPNYTAAAQSGPMPNLVGMGFWWGVAPALPDYHGCSNTESSWTSFITNPYNILANGTGGR